LLTGGPERHLRADIGGTAGDDSTISHDAWWWPPVKLAGRYLAPFLARQVGEAADVMPREYAIPGRTTIEMLRGDELVVRDRFQPR
jgi:hypothetical protein